VERVRPAGADSNAALVIEFENVSKTYKSILGRSVRAVEDFSLSVAAGEVFGIAGPNGAGKSTLIGMVLGFLQPTSGSVSVSGRSPRSYVEQNGVGYLSELVAIPPHWRAEAALKRFAILAGVEEQQLPAAVDAAVARLGIEEHRGKKIKALSKGNLQRVGIAQAVAQRAEIYILDEPTHGLDPVWTQRFRDIVNELRSPDRVILIASHNLDELGRLADRVAIIDHGRLQRIVTTKASGADVGDSAYRIVAVRNADLLRAAFPAATEIVPGEFEIGATPLEELNKTLARLMADGLVVSSVIPAHSALERQFREAVGDTQ
jgi:ABC-2 type transport system ATP-binding protein